MLVTFPGCWCPTVTLGHHYLKSGNNITKLSPTSSSTLMEQVLLSMPILRIILFLSFWLVKNGEISAWVSDVENGWIRRVWFGYTFGRFIVRPPSTYFLPIRDLRNAWYADWLVLVCGSLTSIYNSTFMTGPARNKARCNKTFQEMFARIEFGY